MKEGSHHMSQIEKVLAGWEKAETILLKGALLVDPAAGIEEKQDVFIRKGKIEGLSPEITREADLVIDLSGMICAPGFSDMHVHFREPGGEDAETIASGSLAAARGGFTRVACMPNTTPALDSRGLIEFVISQGRAAGFCRVYPVAAATKQRSGAELTELRELQQAGAIAFSDDGSPVGDALVMRRLLEYAKTWDLLVISHAEEPSLVKDGLMNEGYWSTLLGLRGIPAAAESIAIARDIKLAEMTGGRVHIAHVSTREGVNLIREGKARGISVTGETAPHYFSLTDEALQAYDSVHKVNPPLRTEDDRVAILEGILDGTLDVLATDHAPHTDIAKDQELDAAPPGMIGLETAVGVTMEYLHHREQIGLSKIVNICSTRAAEILGWGGGRIKMGENADLTVIDPDAKWTVDPTRFASLSRNCPFKDWELRGRVKMTVCDGRLTHGEELKWRASERLASQIG
jgi:dihydroorotase